MNLELMNNIGKLIDYSCGWRKSFYRRYPNEHHTPMIKYFDFRIDTRDMNAWLVSLDVHEGQESFRLDPQEIGLLIEFLSIPSSKTMEVFLSDYPITREFSIFNYKIMCRENEEGYYFVTADIEEE